MKINEIENNLWSMANNLRGNMDASEYKNYILGFMFYRFLSEKEEKYLVDQKLVQPVGDESIAEAFKTAIIEEGGGDSEEKMEEGWSDFEEDLLSGLGYAIKPQYLWATIIKGVNDKTIEPSTYQDAITSFDQIAKKNTKAESDFRGIFNEMNLGADRLGPTTVERAKSLSRIVDLVDKTQYVGDSGEDILGEIYEYLIGQFAANAGKKGGEFYTPHKVSELIARIVTDGKEEDGSEFSVFDPACGSGSLLLTVGSRLNKDNKVGAVQYYGQELNTGTYNIGRMNLLMHNVIYQDMHLHNADTLGRDWPDGPDAAGVDHPRMFDAVVENPPYSAKWSADESYTKDPRYKDFNGALAPKSKADYAFLLDGLYHLNKKTGVMGIVLPHGVLFRGGTEGEIRKTLIDKNNIDTIIGLPANLFYGTSIPTIIMILKKDLKNDRNILFIDASQGFEKVKNKNELRDQDIDKIVETYRARKDVDKYAHLATYDEIESNDFNLNIPRYVDITEKEPPVDLDAVLAKIKQDDIEIDAASKRIDEQLRILKVIK
ncbi:type I restriction-modification system subunit M [Lactimicrobium massiliense]|uniref:type I restriction-modification system subunit M n=1 Tax=Lactimicrobium massiliense TaxID=2161814 RepID=UPI000D561A56|nr:type I restriction-modification system subunit M [Lactimicrobium massiliense]